MPVLQLTVNGLLLGGLYLLMAQGLNLIFGVMRIVNFAHGYFIVVGGLLVFSLAEDHGWNPLVALPVAFALFVVVGALAQRLLLEHVKAPGTQGELLTLMVTYGLAYIVINVGLRVWGANSKSVPYLQQSWTVGHVTLNVAFVIASGVAVGLTLALFYWLNFTLSGKSVRATSQSAVGAETCGIDTRMARLVAFALGSGLAGAAGALFVMVRPVAPQVGADLTIICFVVIALGGLGDYVGAAAGAMILGLTETFGGYQFGLAAQSALPYVLMIMIMLLRPQGLNLGRIR